MSVAEQVANFAWNLYEVQPTGNVFFSPVSIALALSMVYFGSEGDTKRQLNAALFNGGDDSNAIQSIQLLMSSVKSVDEPDTKLIWNVANEVFLEQKCETSCNYELSLLKYLKAGVQKVNFNNIEATRKLINEWISTKTNDRIKDIANQITDDALLVLVNAIYFKAQWHEEFMPEATEHGNFYSSNDEATQMPMMHQQSDMFFYGENDECRILGMPYAIGYLRMYILLPKERSGLEMLEQNLSGKKLLDLFKTTQQKTALIKVTMPKFSLEKEIDLKATLQKLGITDMFDKNKADLSAITDSQRLYVSKALHKTFLDINEEGTEAAGITVMQVSPMSAMICDVIVDFTVDHPFLYAIADMQQDMIIFMGRFTGI